MKRIALMVAVAGFFAAPMARAQQASVPFLVIAPDARSSAMGETGTGIADDAAAMFWNPGGLAFQTKPALFLTYSRWLPQFGASDLFYGYVNGVKEMPDWGGTAGLSLTWLNLGQFEKRGEANQFLGLFRSFEFALAGGYGTKLATDLGFGMQLRYIYSSLAPIGTEQETGKGIGQSVSFDLSVLWRPDSLVLFDAVDLSRIITVGGSITNIGPKITYIDAAQADPLPTTMRLGFGVNVVRDEYNDLTFTMDFAKLLVKRDATTGASDPIPKSLFTSWAVESVMKTVQVSVGAEYLYDRVVAIRGGYFTEPEKIGGRTYATFGAGIKYDQYSLDFSYISAANSPLASTLRFTLGFNFE